MKISFALNRKTSNRTTHLAMSSLIANCAFIGFTMPLFSDSIKAAPAPADAAQGAVATVDPTKQGLQSGSPDTSTNGFFNNWGVGLAVIHHSTKVVSDASIVSSTVRVSNETSNDAAILVAKHWYFASKATPAQCALSVWEACFGVMLGVGLGSSSSSSSQVINSVGGGLVVGWNPADPKSAQRQNHNLGIGWGRQFGAKILGDGFREDAAPPLGETQLRYKTTDIPITFIFYTYSF